MNTELVFNIAAGIVLAWAIILTACFCIVLEWHLLASKTFTFICGPKAPRISLLEQQEIMRRASLGY